MTKAPLSSYVQKLLKIVAAMQCDFPKKKFTLDGRLVGDIGEVLAEQLYDLTLYEGQMALHDAVSHGRKVQIKTTMKNSLTIGSVPDYYLGLKIDEEGNVTEIYNGPGAKVWELIKHRKRLKTYLLSLSLSQLKKLNATVAQDDKIPRR